MRFQTLLDRQEHYAELCVGRARRDRGNSTLPKKWRVTTECTPVWIYVNLPYRYREPGLQVTVDLGRPDCAYESYRYYVLKSGTVVHSSRILSGEMTTGELIAALEAKK